MMDATHSKPINRTAALVVSGGTSYTPNRKRVKCRVNSEMPIAAIGAKGIKAPGFQDLTGRRAGRLVAVGMHAEIKKRWVCRCDCGCYVIRTAKAIKNELNTSDMCDDCRHVDYICNKKGRKN